MTLIFGNVQHPPFIDRLIPDAENRAWDDLGPRQPVGVCQHSMLGSLWGTDEYFRRGASGRSLTDYGLGGVTDGPQWDGVILRWNDPLGRATTVDGQAVSANRAPWANGGSDGLEGDGPLFVRRLGVEAINRDLVSIERSDGGKAGAPLSEKQFSSICALTAYWFDQARVPWHEFPLNPATGCVTHLLHYEFATKLCPYPPVTRRIDELQERIRQILKSAQAPDASGEPVPPRPDHDWWPQGYDLAALDTRFGALQRNNPDGSQTTYRFDPQGAISNAWVARGVKEQRRAVQLPPPLAWWTLPDGNGGQVDLVLFAEGWTLYRPGQHWSWLG